MEDGLVGSKCELVSESSDSNNYHPTKLSTNVFAMVPVGSNLGVSLEEIST